MDPNRDREQDDDNFLGLSRRILLAAVLSLIFVGTMVALLHFYARYLALRQARRRRDLLNSLAAGQVAPVDLIAVRTSTLSVYRDPQQPAALQPGLDVSVIASLPAFVWTDGDGGELRECSVCLSLVAGGARVRMLPNCKHVFHVECIDKWLGSHATCPVCRAEAVPRRVSREEKAVVEARVQPSAPPRDMVRQSLYCR